MTCATISPATKSRCFAIIPLAQKVQPILQPTCVVTQIDKPYSCGINTVSINNPSANSNKNLRVPSVDCCLIFSFNTGNVKVSFNFAIKSFDKFVISSKLVTRLRYNQSHNCPALNFFSPCSSNHATKSSYGYP